MTATGQTLSMPNFARTTPPVRGRLLWLDAARGIAAIAVMCYHFDDLLHLRPLLKSAYLAVDLFFMMSGFVLCHSYEQKLLSGQLSVRRYLLSRFLRLYPTYIVATMLGLFYYVGKIALNADDAPGVLALLKILSSNILFIPVVVDNLVPTGMFPFAPSSWSLATEVIASILFALFLVRAGGRLLGACIVLFGLVFCVFVAEHRIFDLGWGIANFIPGIFRTLFEFSFGIALYRIAKSGKIGIRLDPAVFLALVTIVLIFGVYENIVFSALCAFVLFPMFILSTAGKSICGFRQVLFHELGRISYAVYLLHAPMLLWVVGAYKVITKGDPFAGDARWLGWMLVLCVLMASYIVVRWIDEPVRAWIGDKLRASRQRI